MSARSIHAKTSVTGYIRGRKDGHHGRLSTLFDEFLKPRLLPAICPTEFNYPIDNLGKWHGTRYRFIQRYRSGFPENLGEVFDSPFVYVDGVVAGGVETERVR